MLSVEYTDAMKCAVIDFNAEVYFGPPCSDHAQDFIRMKRVAEAIEAISNRHGVDLDDLLTAAMASHGFMSAVSTNTPRARKSKGIRRHIRRFKAAHAVICS